MPVLQISVELRRTSPSPNPLTSAATFISNRWNVTKAIRYHRKEDAMETTMSKYSCKIRHEGDDVVIKNAPSPYEYIIAVYGYRNASFTIQGRSSDDKLTTVRAATRRRIDKQVGDYRVMAPTKEDLESLHRLPEVKSTYANKCVGRSCGGVGSAQVVDKRPGQGVYQDLTKCDVSLRQF